MTTIAANRVCMASDSSVITGDTFYVGRPKVLVIGRVIVGAAGDCSAINKLMRWLAAGGKKKHQPTLNKKDDLSALILSPDGLFHTDKTFEIDEVKSEYLAVGTGEIIALTAMDLGADPVRAVEAACKRDPNNTKGPVHVLYLKDLLKKKARH